MKGIEPYVWTTVYSSGWCCGYHTINLLHKWWSASSLCSAVDRDCIWSSTSLRFSRIDEMRGGQTQLIFDKIGCKTWKTSLLMLRNRGWNTPLQVLHCRKQPALTAWSQILHDEDITPSPPTLELGGGAWRYEHAYVVSSFHRFSALQPTMFVNFP